MKVLLVHNAYGKYSGEEAVIDKMIAMLSRNGCQVAQLRLTTENSRDRFAGNVRGFLCGFYSPTGVRAMRAALLRERPDVVNVHNLYPFISPAALFECRKAGIPVVMTIHNFRLMCPTGLFMRNGRPCELCLEHRNEWRCIWYNCEHSFPKSLGYALRNTTARWSGAYRKCVSHLACITEFQRRKLIDAGFDPNCISVIPNTLDLSESESVPGGDYVAFCGRLSWEKGVDMIVEVARRHPEIQFRFAGALRDGELLAELPGNVEFTGYLSGEKLVTFYRNAAFFVMASRWYEGFPMSILEAAQYGKPTVGPDHGGFTEIIGRNEAAIGRLFTPGDTDDLERNIVALWNAPQEVGRLGALAYARLKKQYDSEVVRRQWQELFLKIISGK